jgi:hypothetical protein
MAIGMMQRLFGLMYNDANFVNFIETKGKTQKYIVHFGR